MASITKRMAKNGDVTYRALIRKRGCPAQSATFKSITKAREWERQTEAAIVEGKYFGRLKAQKHTIGEAIDRYIKRNLPLLKPYTAYNWLPKLNWWKEAIGWRRLSDLTPALLIETRDKLSEKVTRGQRLSPSAQNRYMTALQVVISKAYKEWEWIEVDPFVRVKKLPEPKGRVRYLDDEERERLLEACRDSQVQSPYLYPAVVIAMSTGARKNEIMSLRWENVDLKARRAILQETKNGERRSIPLVEEAYETMKELYDNKKSDIWVFPNRYNDGHFQIAYSWDIARRLAGITNFRFHDLRHTCASYLAMNGATMGEIADVLGHKTLQMTKRYSHFSDAHKQSVVESMNKKIFNNKEEK